MTPRNRPLENRRAVMLGGTGGVGEHMVRAYLGAGAEVIVPSRTAERAESLIEDPAVAAAGSPITIVGDYVSFEGARATAERILDEHGPVDHVVATLGSWWSGVPLWEAEEEEWRRFFVEVSGAYTASARAWLPLLPPSGSLQLVLGASGVVPVPGASLISMAQASLVMMRRVIAEEAGDARRVFSIVLGNLNLRRRGFARRDAVDAEDAARVSIALAAGRRRSEEWVLRRPDQAAAALATLGVPGEGEAPVAQTLGGAAPGAAAPGAPTQGAATSGGGA